MRTAPTTVQPAPFRPERPYAASSWRSAQTPLSPASAASSPNPTHQSPAPHCTSNQAVFCRGSLDRPIDRILFLLVERVLLRRGAEFPKLPRSRLNRAHSTALQFSYCALRYTRGETTWRMVFTAGEPISVSLCGT